MLQIEFPEKFPWGAPTKFKEKIQSGQKKFAFVEDLGGNWIGDQLQFFETDAIGGQLPFNLNYLNDDFSGAWSGGNFEVPSGADKYFPAEWESLPTIRSIEKFYCLIATGNPTGKDAGVYYIDICLPPNASFPLKFKIGLSAEFAYSAFSSIYVQGLQGESILHDIADQQGMQIEDLIRSFLYKARDLQKNFFTGYVVHWDGPLGGISGMANY